MLFALFILDQSAPVFINLGMAFFAYIKIKRFLNPILHFESLYTIKFPFVIGHKNGIYTLCMRCN